MARQAVANGDSAGTAEAGRLRAGASLALGAVAAVLVGTHLTGSALPFLAGEREALLALALVGMAMCGSGPLGRIAAKGSWFSWGGIIGSLLGVLALALVVAGLGLVQLPLVTSAPAAFRALAGLMALKAGFGIVWRLAR